MSASQENGAQQPMPRRVQEWARRGTDQLGRLAPPRMLRELSAVVPRDRLLRWIRWAGLLLVVVALYAMIRVFSDSWAELRGWRPTPLLTATVVALMVVWAGVGAGLGLAWAGLVEGFGQGSVRRRQLIREFARVQASRYLPGNAFQVARHLMARAAGVGHTALVAAALVEAVVLVAAASLLAAAGAPRLAVPEVVPSSLMLAGLIAIGVLVVVLVRVLAARLKPLLRSSGRHGSAMIRAAGLYFVYFLAGGAILAALLAAQGRPLDLGDVGGLVAAFALAWVTGFLAPAAPEGVGVREAALLMVLGGPEASSEQVIAVILLRLVFVGGDAMLVLAASGVKRVGWGHRWRHRLGGET